MSFDGIYVEYGDDIPFLMWIIYIYIFIILYYIILYFNIYIYIYMDVSFGMIHDI